MYHRILQNYNRHSRLRRRRRLGGPLGRPAGKILLDYRLARLGTEIGWNFRNPAQNIQKKKRLKTHVAVVDGAGRPDGGAVDRSSAWRRADA
jgi:hypothetical protein